MKILFAAVIEAREAGTGRRLCDLFMFKPSKKDYPDYYKVILEPMDLRTIEHNIRSDRYMTEDEMVDDMKLMFRNARHYNEEGSQVRSDLSEPTLFPVRPPGRAANQPGAPMSLFLLKVYNDADILEKILTDRRRDLGPARDDDDAVSPKLKISTSLRQTR